MPVWVQDFHQEARFNHDLDAPGIDVHVVQRLVRRGLLEARSNLRFDDVRTGDQDIIGLGSQ